MSTQSDHARRARLDSEPPSAVGEMGWRYHHIGIPTQTPRPNEIYLPAFRMYVSGFRFSPYGVEWMRFDDDCPLPELIKTVPHIAFEVDNLAMAIEGKEILIHPNSPSAGVTVAMIIADGAPVELLEFRADLRTPSK